MPIDFRLLLAGCALLPFAYCTHQTDDAEFSSRQPEQSLNLVANDQYQMVLALESEPALQLSRSPVSPDQLLDAFSNKLQEFHSAILSLVGSRVLCQPWSHLKRQIQAFLAQWETFEHVHKAAKIRFLIECLLSCKVNWTWRTWLNKSFLVADQAEKWYALYTSLMNDFKDFLFHQSDMKLGDRTRLDHFKEIERRLLQRTRDINLSSPDCLICQTNVNDSKSESRACSQCGMRFCLHCLVLAVSAELPVNPGRCPHCRAVWVPRLVKIPHKKDLD